jgi:hypothetical protein
MSGDGGQGFRAAGLPGGSWAVGEYIPGSGGALVSSMLTAAVVGWLAFRVSSACAEAQDARERARMKKLRKKGKGKGRAAG